MHDRRVQLSGVKGYKAATVNAYLAPIRAIVCAEGRTLKVKSVKQVQAPVETLDARDLGRLINAVDGPHWSDKRDVALINVMARAGTAGQRSTRAQGRRCRTRAAVREVTGERGQGAEGKVSRTSVK